MRMLKSIGSYNTWESKHRDNFIEVKENGLNSNRIGFVYNVKKYISSRLNKKRWKNFLFRFGLLCCVYK